MKKKIGKKRKNEKKIRKMTKKWEEKLKKETRKQNNRIAGKETEGIICKRGKTTGRTLKVELKRVNKRRRENKRQTNKKNSIKFEYSLHVRYAFYEHNNCIERHNETGKGQSKYLRV